MSFLLSTAVMIRRLLFSLMWLGACATPRATQQKSIDLHLAADSSTHIAIDTREELFSIIFRIAGAEEYRAAPSTKYVRDVDAHFEKFREHPAIHATQALRESNGISFDAPQTLLVYLDSQLVPRRPLAPLPPGMDERWNGVNLDEYLEKIRDFARVSDASAFFAAHAPYYRAVEARFRAPVESASAVAWFDALFGKRSKAQFIVIPGLLIGGGNYGVRVVLNDGQQELYQVISLENLDENELPQPSDATVALLVHETAHSYVNPFLEPHFDELEPSLNAIYALVEKPMRRQAYGDAQSLGNESLVRAVTILYLKDRLGARRAYAQARAESLRSFFWAGDLAQLLENYRRERSRSSASLEEFFPQLASFFAHLKAEYTANGLSRIEFLGPINATWRGEVATVAPEASTRDVSSLTAYLTAQKAKPNQVPYLTAKGKTWDSLSPMNVALYGSPASNPLVQDFLAQNAWKVSSDGISVGEKRVEGDDLVLIACRRHPKNPYRGVVVYTAHNDSALVGIDSVFHGPTDWVVAKRLQDGKFEVVETGDFEPPAPWAQ